MVGHVACRVGINGTAPIIDLTGVGLRQLVSVTSHYLPLCCGNCLHLMDLLFRRTAPNCETRLSL